MNTRTLVLLIASILLVTIYFNVGQPNKWYNERIKPFSEDISAQLNEMGLEKRKRLRWNNPYIVFSSIKGYLKTAGIKNALILTPPPSYASKFSPAITMPEPVIVYYYTGLRSTTIGCEDIRKANFCIVANPNRIPSFIAILDSTDLNNRITELSTK